MKVIAFPSMYILNKTEVINDPLGLSHSPTNSKQYFTLKIC